MTKKNTTAPEAGNKPAPPKRAAPIKRPGTKARAEAVKKILRKVEKQMSDEDVKASLGDYIRLFQLAKEMGEMPKSHITVAWVDPIEE